MILLLIIGMWLLCLSSNDGQTVQLRAIKFAVHNYRTIEKILIKIFVSHRESMISNNNNQ